MSQDMEEECWEYLDPRSVKRGPFSGKRMAQWYDHQMLPEDLGVRHHANMPWTPIKDLFHPPLLPFRTQPWKQPVVARCAAHWQYCDTRGQLQGPFTSAQMALWSEHGMLPKSLMLRRTTDTSFATISDFFPRNLVPFVSQPVNPFQATQAATAFVAPKAATKAAAKPAAVSKQVGIQQAAPLATPAQQHAARQQQQQQQQLQQQPVPNKGKAAPKGKAAAKAEAAQRAAYPDPADAEGGKGDACGKGAGRGGPIGCGEKGGRGQRGKQGQMGGKDHHQKGKPGWAWNEQDWSCTDKAWWEWSSWNSWAPELGAGGNGWEQHNGREKQHGADWKGSGNDGNGPIGASPAKDKGDKGVEHPAFGNLRWGPPMDEAHLFPEPPVRKILDEGIVWEERWISPLAVRFSQGKIHPFFHERGPISEVLLQIRLREESGKPYLKRIEPPFPPIRLLHLKEQGVLITLDNRRLYALQRFALQEWPVVCLAKVLCVDELTPTRLRAENRKFTNCVCGLQLEVESRSNAFDTFSWVTETAHLEAARFLRPVSFCALCPTERAMSVLPMLVVHALVSRRFQSLLASRFPFLRFLALTLRNPQKREFHAKRLLWHHVHELARPARKVVECPSVCVGYKAETVVTLRNGKSCVKSVLSLTRPLTLLTAPQPLSDVQQQVLSALLPVFCLPYARSALRGQTRDWVVALLLAWGKVAAVTLKLPQGP